MSSYSRPDPVVPDTADRRPRYASRLGRSIRLLGRDGRRCLSVLAALMIGLVVAGCQVVTIGSSARQPIPAETRLVKHAMGESHVPVAPQRVVVLDTGELDDVLALGVTLAAGRILHDLTTFVIGPR